MDKVVMRGGQKGWREPLLHGCDPQVVLAAVQSAKPQVPPTWPTSLPLTRTEFGGTVTDAPVPHTTPTILFVLMVEKESALGPALGVF